jgi:HK97 family phage major capsid protein
MDIAKSIETIGTSFDAYKKTNDQRLDALKSGNESLASELQAKLDKIDADIKKGTEAKRNYEIELAQQKERIEELEARSKVPGRSAQEKRQAQYKETFIDWIRNKGQSSDLESKLKQLHREAFEAKDVTIGTPAAGGYALPEEIARDIEKLELKFSPVRRLVKVVQTGSSDYKELVNLRGASSGWVGETGSRTATDTSLLRERAPTHGELYAYPQASEWSLDDLFFNVDQWIADEVADSFAREEGDAVIRGNGTNKPTGMTNTAPVATDDFASPLRAAAAYEFVASVADDSPAVAEIQPDALITLVYQLNSAYRAGAVWTMNSTTTGSVRKLKDGNGQYLWQPGLQLGQPDRLLGYGVETWEQMDDVGTNALPIAFGNFKRGYVLTDRVGIRVTRDNVTNIGFVRFYVRRRVGGTVLNNDAIKFLKTTLS